MAIYSLTCKIKSGNKGQSVVASAAYQSAEKLHDEADGLTKNYQRKERVLVNGILAPDNAPDWVHNREQLWNHVEAKEGLRGQYARSWIIALPVELSREQQEKLLRGFVKKEFVARGMVADFAIHVDPEDRNPHAHILTTMRSFRKDGSWAPKARKVFDRKADGKAIFSHRDKNGKKIYKSHKEDFNDWNRKETLEAIREGWADAANLALEKAGSKERIDHRSNADRGLDSLATEHEGYAAREIEKRGQVSERCERNRAIRDLNAVIAEIRAQKNEEREPINWESLNFAQRFELVVRLQRELVDEESAIEAEQEQLKKDIAKEPLASDREVSNAKSELSAAEKEQSDNLAKMKKYKSLLAGKYAKENEPTGFFSGSKRKAWQTARSRIRHAYASCDDQAGALAYRVERAQRAYTYAQQHRSDEISMIAEQRVSKAHPEYPAIKRATSAIARTLDQFRASAARVAGNKGRRAADAYIGSVSAARKPTPAVSAARADAVRGAVPASLIRAVDDDSMKNWLLMTDAAKEEEMNKQMLKSI